MCNLKYRRIRRLFYDFISRDDFYLRQKTSDRSIEFRKSKYSRPNRVMFEAPDVALSATTPARYKTKQPPLAGHHHHHHRGLKRIHSASLAGSS